MDLRVRQNEFCIVGQPQCGYYFNSSRSCFIGYGFNTSRMEVTIISRLLEEYGIEPIEAGQSLSAGQNVFCTKICSKIIQSRFCIIVVNNDTTSGIEVPNANVHSEYGLMLGFNKHIIPFQKDDQRLAFNVSGFDTIKYNQANFEGFARKAILLAMERTDAPKEPENVMASIKNYLVSEGLMYATLQSESERELFDIGSLLGYSLLRDFGGVNYAFMGIYSNLSLSEIKWKLSRTPELIAGLVHQVTEKRKYGLISKELANAGTEVIGSMSVWLVIDEAIMVELSEFIDNTLPKLNCKLVQLEKIQARLRDISDGTFYKTDL